MKKIPCASQNTEAKTLPADVCIFGRLSPAAVRSADCWFDPRGKWWIHVSSIYAKTSFCCIETVANNALNHEHIFVFDCKLTQYPLWTHLSHWQMFMQNGQYTAFWYLQLLCYLTTTSIYNWLKWVCAIFWCFPGQLPNLGNLSVQYHLCLYDQHLKSAYHLLTIISDGSESE